MKRRVTITLDPRVHDRARQVARARRTTVSGLIEGFLREATPSRATTSVVDRMIGSGTLRDPAPGSDPLFEALRNRHLGPDRNRNP